MLIKIKKNIKNLIRSLFDPIAKKLGYIKPINNNFLLSNFLIMLNNIDFKVNHIVDVGANLGQWTRIALKYYPNSFYSLFEPQANLKNRMSDLLVNPKVSLYTAGAGSKNDTLKLTLVDRHDSCTFKYTEEEAKSMGFEQIDVPVYSLSKFFSGKKLPVPELIKIDAEGFDMEVLKGCVDFFGKTEIFFVEASISNPNINNTLKMVIDFMNSKGYRMLDITDLNRPWPNGALWLVEAVFVIRGGFIDRKTSVKK